MKHPSDATREALAHDFANLYVAYLDERPKMDFAVGLFVMVGLAMGAASAWAWVVVLWMD